MRYYIVEMVTKLKKMVINPWILGVFLITIQFAVLFSEFSPQYITNDDAVILRAFMGYEGGEPATFHLFTHTSLAWLLYVLAKLFPGIAWFSILQLLMIWIADVVIVKSFAQLSNRRGLGVLVGAAVGFAFTLIFSSFYIVRMTYTYTAALCGAAAVAQLLSVDFSHSKGVISRIIGSAGLLLCCYSFRLNAIVPPLCFWLLVLMVKLWMTFGVKKWLWPAVKSVILGALCAGLMLGGFVGIRALDIRLEGMEDYMEWHIAREKMIGKHRILAA